VPPFELSRQYLSNGLLNINRFRKSELHWNTGLKTLIGSFYRSITKGEPLPIEYREILWTSRVMEAIFSRMRDVAEGNSDLPLHVSSIHPDPESSLKDRE
jgi:hypothetical protein